MIKVIDDPCTAKVDTLYIVYYCIIYFSVGRDSLISTYPSKNGENQNKKTQMLEKKRGKENPIYYH